MAESINWGNRTWQLRKCAVKWGGERLAPCPQSGHKVLHWECPCPGNTCGRNADIVFNNAIEEDYRLVKRTEEEMEEDAPIYLMERTAEDPSTSGTNAADALYFKWASIPEDAGEEVQIISSESSSSDPPSEETVSAEEHGDGELYPEDASLQALPDELLAEYGVVPPPVEPAEEHPESPAEAANPWAGYDDEDVLQALFGARDQDERD